MRLRWSGRPATLGHGVLRPGSLRHRWFGRAVARRLPGLLLGLVLCGLGIALMAESELGLGPWEAFHQGLGRQLGLPMGTVSILVGIPVLLCWWPLRQVPGIGTVINVALVGMTTNVGLAVMPEVGGVPARIALLVGGVAMMAVGSGLYLGADLGPGPRDGLMTGIHREYGWSIARARTAIEVVVLVTVFALGGTIGIGTILFALSIGPLIQLALRFFDPEGRVMRQREVVGAEPVPAEGAI